MFHTHYGSQVVRALEDAYEAVRADHPELPPVLVYTGPSASLTPRSGTDNVTWGAITRNPSWGIDHGPTPRLQELFVSGEAIARGSMFVFETILHEAAHLLAFERQLADTSRKGVYHNRRFLRCAQELGMTYTLGPPHARYGYAGVQATVSTFDRYADVIAMLTDRARAYVPLPQTRPVPPDTTVYVVHTTKDQGVGFVTPDQAAHYGLFPDVAEAWTLRRYLQSPPGPHVAWTYYPHEEER